MDWSSKRPREEDDTQSSKKPREDDWGTSEWTDGGDDWGSSKQSGGDNWGASKPSGGDNWGASKPGRGDNWGASKPGRGNNWSSSKPSRGDNWGASKPGRGNNWSSSKPGRGDNWGASKPGRGDNWGVSKPGRGDNWGSSKPGGGDNWGSSKPGGGDDWGSSKPSGGDDWGSSKPSGGDDWGSSKPSDGDGGEGDKDAERPQSFKPEQLDLEEEAKLLSDGAALDFKHYDEQKVTCLPPGKIGPVETFEDIVTSKLLMDNIKAQKYTRLTPIQKWAMPAIMEDHDLIACAQTGSGKTAAFLTPMLQTLLSTELEPHDPNNECQNPYCLIISPTRELANQIYVHSLMLSKDSILKCQVMYGQIATAHLRSKILSGCHILVSTPGRLKDFVNRGWLGFKNIKYVILDEGDRLVDEGFTEDIRFFFNHPTMPPKEKRQTLFFSATFKQSTQLSAKEYLKDSFIFLTVGRIGAANADIRQEFMKVSRSEKKRELKKILNEVPENEKTIVFTQTKTAADMLAGFFTALNLSSTSIHGDRLQFQREQAIKAFKKGEKRFLISSPVGNRGLDLPKVALVINYDLPNNIDEYVHRIGRTGRAGHTGRAISFYDEERDQEILPDLIEILREVKQDIPDWMLGQAPGQQGEADEWGGSSSAQPTASSDEWGNQDKTVDKDNSNSENAASDTWNNGANDNNDTSKADKEPDHGSSAIYEGWD